MNNMGLVNAARQIQSYGRGADTQLAHISPDESQFIDYMQGGRKENPHTGLPEYSLFGKILKVVARVAGGVGGFMVGGPAGAAAGAGAATKLTGGSWKDALKGAALAGIGGELGQGLTGGGWSVVGSGTPLAGALSGSASGLTTGAGAATAAGLPAAGSTGLGASLGAASAPSGLVGASPGFWSGLSTAPAAGTAAGLSSGTGLGALGASAGAGSGGFLSGLGETLGPIGGVGGLGAGLGAMAVPLPQPGDDPLNTAGFGNNINLNVAPQVRAYQPYQGDYATYGQPGNSGWQFFDEINPKPKFLAEGGKVSVLGKHERGMTLDSFDELVKQKQEDIRNTANPFKQRHLFDQLNDLYDAKESYTGQSFYDPDVQGNVQRSTRYASGGAVRGYALGGGVMDQQGPSNGLGGLGGLRDPGIPSQIETPHFDNAMALRAEAQNMSPAMQRERIRRNAILGFVNAAHGGSIKGPGGGKDDLIEAHLSNNEHVWSAQDVADLGDGDSDTGHERMLELRAEVRRRAGRKNTHKQAGKQPPISRLLAKVK